MALEEKTVRKWWLVLFFASMVISFVVSAFTYTQGQLSDLGFDPTAMKVMRIVGWGFGLLFWWMTYHFAYVKHGTKWLLALIVSSIYLLLLYALLQLNPELLNTYFPANIPWLSTLQVMMNIPWAIACYLLYKVNRARLDTEEAPITAKVQHAIDTLAAKPNGELTWKEKLLLKEPSVRRIWLITYAFVVLLAIPLALAYSMMIFDSGKAPQLSFEQFNNISSSLFVTGAALWLTYYLAYLRRGTKWLMAIIIAGFVVEATLLYFWQAGVWYPFAVVSMGGDIFLVLFITLTFQISSLLLYVVNKARKNLRTQVA